VELSIFVETQLQLQLFGLVLESLPVSLLLQARVSWQDSRMTQ
jgi:hypothetical protein